MQAVINGSVVEFERIPSIHEVIERFSPYGEDALICKLNGEIIRSIDSLDSLMLHEGDTFDMFPLVIGG
ncbi:MAG: hypothetical protein IJJ14_08505 [Coriobacteriales bacterium]|nr:hypothetical protein [Coriobacteriales bacterium]MBQ6585506.1 hypothetical protein [Coriobacteriales bacterium]